jgi:hypothetical protein
VAGYPDGGHVVTFPLTNLNGAGQKFFGKMGPLSISQVQRLKKPISLPGLMVVRPLLENQSGRSWEALILFTLLFIGKILIFLIELGKEAIKFFGSRKRLSTTNMRRLLANIFQKNILIFSLKETGFCLSGKTLATQK